MLNEHDTHFPQEEQKSEPTLDKVEVTEEQAGYVKLEQQIATLKDQFLRAVAETENVRKRYDKKIEEASVFAFEGFAKSLIEAMDDFFRAFTYYPQEVSPSVKSFLDGIQMAVDSLERVLLKHNITKIIPEEGDTFDPKIHEALGDLTTDKYESGKIASIEQTGYILKDRLLRSAKVKIAKPR